MEEHPMRGRAMIQSALLLLLLAWASSTPGADPAPKPRPGMIVWDTGEASAKPLAPEALAGKNEWTAIPQDQTADAFKGDAVLSNGRIVAVLRKQDAAVEVHSAKPDGAVARLRLRLLTAAGEPAARLERMALIESTKNSICLDATFQTAKGASVTGKFRLKRGEIAIQAEPGTGAGKLRVECPGRFLVLPDFFADDITLDAAKLPLSMVELPSENFVMHLTGNGEAIAMCVFENRQQDVKVTLTGEGEQRQVAGSEIGFEGKKVWVALMEAPRIWAVRDLKAADTDKIVPLDWRMPFPAAWRVDFTRPNGLTDSWEMLLQEKQAGKYVKPSWLGSDAEQIDADRSRWNTVLGNFTYPCWSDADGRGSLQPLKNDVLQFVGPAIVYPINRVKQTPLDAFTAVDVMRNTLGVGPCEHILDVEGNKSEYRGRATCSVRDTLTPIYEKGQQKKQRDKVDKTLDEGLVFVKHIRGRITQYVEFGHTLRQYLAEQKKAHPELTDFINEMDQLTQEIDKHMAARKDKIQTPEHVAQMNEDFRKRVLDYDGPDALKRCKEYAEALVEIGGNQDELVGEGRYVVKALRQRAGIRMALDPKVAPVAQEIRTRTQQALRNPANHEDARH
jgi:hypothetical protein